MKFHFPLLLVCIYACAFMQPAHAERISLNDQWHFSLGHAADPAKDFGCGTEYFTYLTKANSIHNAGPYALAFNDSSWQIVSIPHDWVPALPFAKEASHSHGYHQIGWQYPKNSVGWYRRWLTVDDSWDLNKEIWLHFDGIFRDSRIWVNGFYVGHEECGYTHQAYEISDYLLPGENNLICVRVDASIETGWWYEGAGIYRPVWIEREQDISGVSAEYQRSISREFAAENRTWSKDEGFMVNGKKVELKGVNLHQDHAGVGIAIPKGLMEYRLKKLMDIGVNAIRCSHNPASEEFLDLCDSLGLYVLEENRLMGSSPLQHHGVETMIQTHKHHPCIIAWSVGNEEWGLEWTDRGGRIARHMQDWVHQLDPTRPACVATSSGPHIVRGMDIAGYNYLMQNDIDGERERYPERIAMGTEETTGCGTRGVYFTDKEKGHMAAINRTDSTYPNLIERGWKFYDERPWLAGLFYWTGFDYVGEANPMVWPSVSSEFGLLDLCGFKKDEAYYLQSWWTEKPTLHILPHWNLEGHEGEEVDVWVYSNAEEVELKVNGKSLGRKPMPHNGHLSWKTIYRPGKVEAIGYNSGKRTMRETVYTSGHATQVTTEVSEYRGITILDFTLLDKQGHFAATACNELTVEISGDGKIIGIGNGDPANHDIKPQEGYEKRATVKAFNGHAQVIIEGLSGTWTAVLKN